MGITINDCEDEEQGFHVGVIVGKNDRIQFCLFNDGDDEVGIYFYQNNDNDICFKLSSMDEDQLDSLIKALNIIKQKFTNLE